MGKKTGRIIRTAIGFWAVFLFIGQACGRDLPEIKASGVIRHLGVPYANFITGSGDGMDVELVRLFAGHIGVKYEYVKTSWGSVIEDLIGKKVKVAGDDVQIIGPAPIKGDIIANGFTIIPWREKIVNFSIPVFPTQVWLMARANSPVMPIIPSGNVEKDISIVKTKLAGLTVLGVANTCLDPQLYHIESTGAVARLFPGDLNELAPAIVNNEADATLLDVPDALIALDKWPGKIKVIGPVSKTQEMAVAFAKDALLMKDEFNRFLLKCKSDGRYMDLVKKYYPTVFDYYPGFFK